MRSLHRTALGPEGNPMKKNSKRLAFLASAAFTCIMADRSSLGMPENLVEHDQDSIRETSLTVYSSADPASFDPRRFISSQRSGNDASYAWQVPGFGLVRETRETSIPKGIGEIRFTDVAAFIDPTTVGFKDLTSSSTQVLEQNFEFDLVSSGKLLEKYLDQKISLQFMDKTWSGTLLSNSNDSVVLQKDDGTVDIIPTAEASISMGSLPGGLITRPTLVWKLNSAIEGKHKIQTTYETAGLTWRSDYNLVLGSDDSRADLTAWVSLMNLSGISYENTRLKLVAGDVRRIQPKRMPPPLRDGQLRMEMNTMGAAAAFVEESFFEYHLYTLPRKTDVKSNGTQQIALFNPIKGFTVTKELVFEPTNNSRTPSSPRTDEYWNGGGKVKPSIFIKFKNERENGLGLPLPAGKVRVYKENPRDGGLEFIGEDLIDHTPRNEELRLKLGEAFDVVGERTRMDFKLDKNEKTMIETFRIEIRNQKEDAQEVIVLENMYRWRTWTVTSSSIKGSKVDSNTMKWVLDVPSEGTKVIEYTVKYTW